MRNPAPYSIPPDATPPVDTADATYVALATALIAHLDEMGDGPTDERYVDGLRAELDILLDAGADLTAFADGLGVTVPDLAAVA